MLVNSLITNSLSCLTSLKHPLYTGVHITDTQEGMRAHKQGWVTSKAFTQLVGIEKNKKNKIHSAATLAGKLGKIS